MAAKKVGALIKEARVAADMTQEQLAKKIKGVSAADISKVERGEADLTNEQLKTVAKATGVTQKSLLDAPKNLKSSSSSAKKTSSSSKKTSSSSGSSMKVTATEKKLVQLYREADSETKKSVMTMLKGDSVEALDTGDILNNLISGMFGNIGK